MAEFHANLNLHAVFTKSIVLNILFSFIVNLDEEDPLISCSDINIISRNLLETTGGVFYVATDNGSPNATVSWSSPVVSDNSGGNVDVTSRPYRSSDILPISENPISIEFNGY